MHLDLIEMQVCNYHMNILFNFTLSYRIIIFIAMEKLIVASGIIFNIDRLVYILPHEIVLRTGDRLVVTQTGKTSSSWASAETKSSGIQHIKISEDLYDEIYKKIFKMQNHLKYKEKYEDLKNHLAAAPGGTDYLLAKSDFEENAKNTNE